MQLADKFLHTHFCCEKPHTQFLHHCEHFHVRICKFADVNKKGDDKMKTITKNDYRANAFDVDFRKQLLFEVLGRNILDTADMNSETVGHGMGDLAREGRSWVISRMTIEMSRMPRVYEKYSVETWFESLYRMFANRNSAIIDADGGVLGYARTVYSIIDNGTRQPLEIMQHYGDAFEPLLNPDRICNIEGHSHIRPLKVEEPVLSLNPVYHDLDCNGHFNSVKYSVHLTDLFSRDFYEKHELKRIELAYVAESYYGDTLNFYLKETEPLQFQAEIRRQGRGDSKETTTVRALITFE